MRLITHVLHLSDLLIFDLLSNVEVGTGQKFRLSGNYGKMCKVKAYRPVQAGRLKRPPVAATRSARWREPSFWGDPSDRCLIQRRSS